MKEQGSFNQHLENSVGDSIRISLKVQGALLSSVAKVAGSKGNKELAIIKIYQIIGRDLGHPRLASLISNLIWE